MHAELSQTQDLGTRVPQGVLALCQAALQGSDAAVLVCSSHAQALQLPSHLCTLLPEGCADDALCNLQLPLRVWWERICDLQIGDAVSSGVVGTSFGVASLLQGA